MKAVLGMKSPPALLVVCAAASAGLALAAPVEAENTVSWVDSGRNEYGLVFIKTFVHNTSSVDTVINPDHAWDGVCPDGSTLLALPGSGHVPVSAGESGELIMFFDGECPGGVLPVGLDIGSRIVGPGA